MSGFNIIEYDCWDWMNDVGFYHDSLSDTWLLLMDNIMIVHSMTTVVLKYDNKYLKNIWLNSESCQQGKNGFVV